MGSFLIVPDWCDTSELPPPDGWVEQYIPRQVSGDRKKQAQLRAKLIPLYAERYEQRKDIFNGETQDNQKDG